MKQKLYRIIGAFLMILFLSACTTTAPDKCELAAARKMLKENKAACVLMKDGKIILSENGRGISPLLVIYDKLNGDMRDTVVVDKVIGRATAAIAICGKVKHVHAEVMSQEAVDFLNEYKITSSYTLLVPRILNRTRDGLCPMESTVLHITDPYKAVEAVRAKQIELRRSAQKK